MIHVDGYRVTHCVTMGHMATRSPREYVSIRLSPNGLARVRELADQETEGNLSQMIRKLLSEALTARDRRRP